MEKHISEPLMTLWFGNFYRPAYDDREFVDNAMQKVRDMVKNLGINTFGHAQLVLVGKNQTLAGLDNLYEFIFSYFANGTLLGSLSTFVNISAYQTSEFLCHSCKCYFSCYLIGFLYILCTFQSRAVASWPAKLLRGLHCLQLRARLSGCR